MTGHDREYDRFGPWVIAISDEDSSPPLFVPHMTRTETPLLAIKIPRKVSRRDAHPGMDLYDYMVSLYEDDMVILERTERDVRTTTITYRDIRLLRVREDLLRGNIHLGLAERPFDLPYNTVSNEVMRRFAGLIRDRYGVHAQEPIQPSEPTEPITLPHTAKIDRLSFYFEGLLGIMRNEGSAFRPLAAQTDIQLGSLETSVLRKVLFGVVDKRLLESLHLSDGRELWVIDRGRPYAYRWQTVYGREETFMPLANITTVTWDNVRDDTLTTLSISTEGGTPSWAFTTDNASLVTYRAWLNELSAISRI